jgi:hypothetical protein
MRITKLLAVSTAGCALAASAMLPAMASTHHVRSHPSVSSKTKLFKSTLSPKTHIKTGTVMTLKAHGALKNTGYDCVLVVLKGAANAPNFGSIHAVKSSKKGTFTCKETFAPFSGSVKGKTVSCPPSKKELKKGYKCGFAASTTNKKSATIQYFT